MLSQQTLWLVLPPYCIQSLYGAKPDSQTNDQPTGALSTRSQTHGPMIYFIFRIHIKYNILLTQNSMIIFYWRCHDYLGKPVMEAPQPRSMAAPPVSANTRPVTFVPQLERAEAMEASSVFLGAIQNVDIP